MNSIKKIEEGVKMCQIVSEEYLMLDQHSR